MRSEVSLPTYGFAPTLGPDLAGVGRLRSTFAGFRATSCTASSKFGRLAPMLDRYWPDAACIRPNLNRFGRWGWAKWGLISGRHCYVEPIILVVCRGRTCQRSPSPASPEDRRGPQGAGGARGGPAQVETSRFGAWPAATLEEFFQAVVLAPRAAPAAARAPPQEV